MQSLAVVVRVKYDTGFEYKAPEFGGGDQGDTVKYPSWYDKLESDDEQPLLGCY